MDSIVKRLGGDAPAAAATGRGVLAPKPTAPSGGAGKGDVSVVMMLNLETEVEMKLPGRFRISPQIAGAIKAVTGVVQVEML